MSFTHKALPIFISIIYFVYLALQTGNQTNLISHDTYDAHQTNSMIPSNQLHTHNERHDSHNDTNQGHESHHSMNDTHHGGNDSHHAGNHSANHHGHHGVHVASWNFPYVSSPLLFCLFIMAVAILKLFFHYVECLSAVVPESCLLIIFGLGVGAILEYAVPKGYNSVISTDSFSLEPRLFMLFLLPPVVLDSAYSLNDKVFFENLGSILLYAVIGTILNYFMIGPLLYGFCLSGILGPISMNFVQCMLFASFIVAVDPVAVLAIFQEIGVNNILYFLVFGESLLNDAVTVVLYNMMKAFNGMETIPTEQMLLGVLSFFTVSLGGLSIGLIFGVLTCFLTRITGHIGVYLVEPLILLVMAYLSFLCAELVHWSGIISMIGCGLVQSEYAFHNVSEKSLVTVNYFVKMLSSLSDAIIFLFLGLEVIKTQHVWHTGFVVCSLLLCLLCRLISITLKQCYSQLGHNNMYTTMSTGNALLIMYVVISRIWIAIFGLTLIARPFRQKPVSIEEQFIMWYGGLRGAVCFALCATLNDEFKFKNMFLTTALVIVFFTVFIQGITIKPLVNLMKITKLDEKTHETSMAVQFQINVTEHVMTGIECVVGNTSETILNKWAVYIDRNYLRQILRTNPKSKEEEFLEIYQKIAIRDHVNHIYESTSKVVAVNDLDDSFDNDLYSKEESALLAGGGMSKPESSKNDRQMNDFELKQAMDKAFNSTFGGKKLDKNITGASDSANLVAKLRAKHSRLQENKLLRSPNPSRQGSLRSVKSPMLKEERDKKEPLSPETDRSSASRTGKIRFTSVSSYDSTRDLGDVFEVDGGASAAVEATRASSGHFMRPIEEEQPPEISLIGWNSPSATQTNPLQQLANSSHPTMAYQQQSTSRYLSPHAAQSSPRSTGETLLSTYTPQIIGYENNRFGYPPYAQSSSYLDVPITRMPLRTDLRSISPAHMFGRTNAAFVPDDRQFSHKTVISLLDEGQGYCTVVRMSEDGTTTSTQTKM